MRNILNLSHVLIASLLIIASYFTYTYTAHAQTPSEPPSFLESVTSEEEYNALSEKQKNEIKEYHAISRPQFPDVRGFVLSTENTVSCFDYYSFGSVQVDLSPILEQTIPGVPFTFKGQLKNKNPYPVVDGQVYAKIFKLDRVTPELTKENGYPLVDFFLVQDNINIQANTNQDLSFDWQVPRAFAGGEYQIAFFFTTAHRFNLMGLSFTDDVTGNTASFSITPLEETTSPVAWNKNKVTLNNIRVSFALPPRHFTNNEEITAYTELINSSNETRIVEITWITSKWDGILDSNEHKRETIAYELKSKETKQISYSVPTLKTSVTFLEAIAQDRDAKSIMHIRFVRDDNQEVRINFPSILSYPLKQGEESTIFSCLHSTNLPIVEDNTLTLALTDVKNNLIHSYTYEGGITGAMMGVKDIFTPTKDISTFTLTATLAHRGEVIEEITIQYNCMDIDESLCIEEGSEGTAGDSPSENNTTNTFVVLSLLLVITSFVVYGKRKRAQNITADDIKN